MADWSKRSATGGNTARIDITVSEALVLGLIKQNVHTFFVVFGHGSTRMAEVLRVYQRHGLVKVMNTRSEIEASHAATALRWVTGQKSAVITCRAGRPAGAGGVAGAGIRRIGCLVHTRGCDYRR